MSPLQAPCSKLVRVRLQKLRAQYMETPARVASRLRSYKPQRSPVQAMRIMCSFYPAFKFVNLTETACYAGCVYLHVEKTM